MGTVSPAQVSDGTGIDASDVNNPINTIANEFNGNIDNNNVKSGANIATAKLASDAGIITAMLADSAVTPAKIFAGNGSTWPWQTGTPLATGFASKTSDTLRYCVIGKVVVCTINIQGTSNATTLTFTLPFAAKDGTDSVMVRAANSGAFLTTPGLITFVSSSTTASCFKDLSGAAFANTLVKGAVGVFTYETA